MTQSPKPTVLIVEDEDLIRMLAVDGFIDAGFTVLEAAHAAEAIRIHGCAHRVEVLFTDVNMPGELNGIDLAERLRATAPGLHIVITSALPLQRPLHHLGATFIEKPYDVSEVCRATRNLLAA
ncbi:MAG: response regulator [Phenylobacterium sp.]